MKDSNRIQNSKREEWLDCAKGFASIMVVMGHITHGYLGAKIYTEYEGVMLVLDNVAYAFHMPLFFLLSGFAFGLAYVGGQRAL